MFVLTTQKKTSVIISHVCDTVKILLAQNEFIEVEIEYSIHQKTNSVILFSQVLYFKIMDIKGKKQGEKADITLFDFLVSFVEKVFDQRLLDQMSEEIKINALKICNATGASHSKYTLFLLLKVVYGDVTKLTNVGVGFVFDIYVENNTQKTCFFFEKNVSEIISQLETEKPKNLAQAVLSVKRLLVEEIKYNGVTRRYYIPM